MKKLLILLLAMSSLSIMAQRHGGGHRGGGHNGGWDTVPHPRDGHCPIYRIQNLAQDLAFESRDLTQEARMIFGPSHVTRIARDFTQEARFFKQIAESSYRCRRIKAQFPQLQRQFRMLKQTILNRRGGGHYGGGHYGGYASGGFYTGGNHYGNHGPRRRLARELGDVEFVMSKLRRLVMLSGRF